MWATETTTGQHQRRNAASVVWRANQWIGWRERQNHQHHLCANGGLQAGGNWTIDGA
jgi:hypothetical protein